MALGVAYVAHTQGADTAYYNPANMAFMGEEQFAEVGVTWAAHLPSNRFEGTQTYSATDANNPASNESKIENLQLPFLHYVSNPIGQFHWGASLSVPRGLTKEWDSGHQKVFAKEFTLKIIEVNPVVSYKLSDNFSVGGGLRLIYSEGVVKSDGGTIQPIKRDMQGDTVEYGYNLAMTYKPTSDINMAVTYRSNIDLKEEGDANLYLGNLGNKYSANVTVPLPAALNLAVSKTWQDRYTVELNYEKTYWSEYKNLDFNYGKPLSSTILTFAFDNPKAKNWKDTNTYRVGLTAKVSPKLTLMAGYSKDETPISKQYISYELPDSDANIYTFGFRIKANENLSYGFAYLHDQKDSFSLAQGENDNKIVGTFSGGGADLLTAGVAYRF